LAAAVSAAVVVAAASEDSVGAVQAAVERAAVGSMRGRQWFLATR